MSILKFTGELLPFVVEFANKNKNMTKSKILGDNWNLVTDYIRFRHTTLLHLINNNIVQTTSLGKSTIQHYYYNFFYLKVKNYKIESSPFLIPIPISILIKLLSSASSIFEINRYSISFSSKARP